MSRRRRQTPPPPPVVWPDLTPARDSKPEPEPAESNSGPVSRLGYCEFHRLANRILDAVDAKRGTGQLYTPDEIARNCRAREILREELDRIFGRRDNATFQTIESANQICGNVLKFDSKRTPSRRS